MTTKEDGWKSAPRFKLRPSQSVQPFSEGCLMVSTESLQLWHAQLNCFCPSVNRQKPGGSTSQRSVGKPVSLARRNNAEIRGGGMAKWFLGVLLSGSPCLQLAKISSPFLFCFAFSFRFFSSKTRNLKDNRYYLHVHTSCSKGVMPHRLIAITGLLLRQDRLNCLDDFLNFFSSSSLSLQL